ncbi:hypothetical protein AGOR_G00124460 [Albula goreensis]|uniref:Synaptotagmin-like protein 2 n=1 Tax=Albula goreensis TaxID=1534307 RepID=A0A8T3DBE5_9TELE|nr:hypothetical protein AGOR_G00124460 [Albula goreensis]
MIDLSYLTEEEQEMIMTVLKRDAELKKAEEDRVKQLQKLLPDKGKLKYMTGEWFYEAKSQRHTDRIHGSDIIRASIKQSKPMTLLDLTQSWTERTSAFSNGNKNSLFPSEPLEVSEEPLPQSKEQRENENICPDPEQEAPKQAVRSPARPRHNPFNRASQLLLETPGETDCSQTNGGTELHKTTAGEPLSSPKTDIADPTDDLCSESPGAIQGAHSDIPPIPKNRTIIFGPLDYLSESDSTFPRLGCWRVSHDKTVPPRGILKNSISLSSNDSGPLYDGSARYPEPLSTVPLRVVTAVPDKETVDTIFAREGEVKNDDLDDSVDRKQVRNSPLVSLSNATAGLQLCDGREFGDDDLLDLDHPTPLNEKRGVSLPVTGSQMSENEDDLTLAPGSDIWQPQEGERSFLAASGTFLDGHSASLLSNERKSSLVTRMELPSYESLAPPMYDLQRYWWKGQHENRAETKPPQVSYLLPSKDEKGKPVCFGMVGHKAPPVLAVQNAELNEEEGDSIAKVLEWFSRSSDSSDRQEENVCQQEVDVEINEQPEVPENVVTFNKKLVDDKASPVVPKDDVILSKKMLEDSDQLVMSKDSVTKINQTTEKTLSEGPPPAEVNSESLRGMLLERSPMIEEKDMICVEPADEDQKYIGQGRTCSRSLKDESAGTQHPASSSLNTETAYQLKLRMSTAETRPQGQKKENETDTKRECALGAKAITLSPVLKQRQQEIKQVESRNDKPPLRVAHLKSFWEKGNSGPKILIGRSSVTPKNSDIRQEPITQNDSSRTKAQYKVDPYKKGQEVPPRPEGICTGTEEQEPERFEFPNESCNLQQNKKEEDMKYVAKCIVVDEDAHISPAEVKVDFQEILQKEDVPPQTVPLSRQIMAGQPSSPVLLVKQSPNRLDNSAGKIRHLKSFWESEKYGPKVISGKQKEEVADTKENQLRAPPSRMSNRFSKSAFDLSRMGTDEYDSGEDVRPLKQGPNFIVLSLKERMEKASVGQNPTNPQFKNLCNFWGGAPSNWQNSKPSSSEIGPLSPKSPRSKECRKTGLQKSLSPSADKKLYLNPNYYPRRPSKDFEKAHLRAQRAENFNLKTYSIDIASPKRLPKEREHPSLAPLPRQESGSSEDVKPFGSAATKPTTTTAETKATQLQRHILGQEQQKPPHCPHPRRGSEQAQLIEARALSTQKDKQSYSQGPRRTSLGNTSGRVNPLRRAASMYAVNLAEEEQPGSPERPKKIPEGPLGRRQSTQREASERRPSGASDSAEQPQPLARSFIPRDYQHYLGISQEVTFQSMPATVKREEETASCFLPDSELELSKCGGPVQASTPVVSEEPRARRGSEGQHSWHSHRGTDIIDLDSYRSTSPETRSYSGTSSACDDEDRNPVRKALKRAALKPVIPSKSVEDITSLPMREEKSKNTTKRELMLSMDDVSVVSSSPPSSISAPAQMKKLSRSVPAFLQKEGNGRDSDSTSEGSVYTGRQAVMGSSLTNCSSSSGMASVSSTSGSVMSLYSADFGSVEVRGTIQFSINYVQKLKEFHIFVMQCRNLAAVDPGKNRSNPYVKCYLLPDEAKLGKRKTSVKRKTLNPNFNEILRYRIRMETLKAQTLNISVWHNDTFGRNSFLGEVEVDLSKWDFGNTQMNNFTLKPRTQSGLQPTEYKGEMRLALRFLPQISYSNTSSNTGEVHIWVKDCKDLPIVSGTSVDPFVKCFVLPDTSRKSRQKTRVLKRTQNPNFNHTMVYDGFRTEDLPEACVELTVWDHDRLASHFVGGLRLGLGTGKSYGALVDWMDSNADEANLWERMLDSPNEWVEDVLPLRMLTMAKNVWK